MKRLFPLVAAAALVAFGAGCGSKPTTTSQPYATETDPYATNEPVMTPPEETVATSSVPVPESSTTTPPTSMTNEPLAFPGVLPESEITNKIVRLKTTKGEITFELLPKEGPNAVSNFVYLTKKKFYDGLTFHRVIEGFMAQGGDPLGQGYGGPGYQFADDKVTLPYSKGIVAMANAGKNTNGSQFFIMKEDYPLGPDYSIFGRVLSGQDVVDALRVGDAMTEVTVENKK